MRETQYCVPKKIEVRIHHTYSRLENLCFEDLSKALSQISIYHSNGSFVLPGAKTYVSLSQEDESVSCVSIRTSRFFMGVEGSLAKLLRDVHARKRFGQRDIRKNRLAAAIESMFDT